MKILRSVTWLAGLILMFASAGSLLAAFDAGAPGSMFRRGDLAGKQGVLVAAPAADANGYRAPQSAAACRQVITNPQLDIRELGPNIGTADPWIFLDPVIYFFEEDDGTGLAYDGYSLVLPDGDDGDPTPMSDILAQMVSLDEELESITVSYQRLMLDSNTQDGAFGELWLLTAEGDIDLTNPAEYRVARWAIAESEDVWSEETIEVEAAALERLSGQEAALLLRTETDGGGATEADEEWVLFDDVTMTNCWPDEIAGGTVYLPAIRRQ